MPPRQLVPNPMPWIAALTRRVQAMQPQRPVKGMTRFSAWMTRLFPAYQGVIRLPDGVRLEVDSRLSAERALLFTGSQQPAVAHLLKQHTPRGGICLDIGANLGFFTLEMAHWTGSSGRVVAFEANPALVERIRRHVSLNALTHVDVVGQPVHSRIEPITFYVAPNPGKSSIWASHVDHPLQALSLVTLTIDAYGAAQTWPQLDAIKIDIEGNDCNALIGARETLARFHPFLLFEYWYNTPADVSAEAFGLLETLGYTLRGLLPDGTQFPLERHALPPNRKHIDIIGLPG